jgi:hypothetical protein
MNSLAETQAYYVRAIADDHTSMIDIWDAEVNRIQHVIDNWDTLAVDDGDN